VANAAASFFFDPTMTRCCNVHEYLFVTLCVPLCWLQDGQGAG
jgi:hypothetical protein